MPVLLIFLRNLSASSVHNLNNALFVFRNKRRVYYGQCTVTVQIFLNILVIQAIFIQRFCLSLAGGLVCWSSHQPSGLIQVKRYDTTTCVQSQVGLLC